MLKKLFFLIFLWIFSVIQTLSVEPLLIILDDCQENFINREQFKDHRGMTLTHELLQALALPECPIIITARHILYNILIPGHIYEQTALRGVWDFVTFYTTLKHIPRFSDTQSAFTYFTYFQQIGLYIDALQKTTPAHYTIASQNILHKHHTHHRMISFYCAAFNAMHALKNFVIYKIPHDLYIIIPHTQKALIQKLSYLDKATYDQAFLISQKKLESLSTQESLIHFISKDFKPELKNKIIFLCGHGRSCSPQKRGVITEFYHHEFCTFTKHLTTSECLIVDCCELGGINQKYITIDPLSCPIITIGGVENASTKTCGSCTITPLQEPLKEDGIYFAITNTPKWKNLTDILKSYQKTNAAFLKITNTIWPHTKNSCLIPEHFYTLWQPQNRSFTPLLTQEITYIPSENKKPIFIFKKHTTPEFIIIEPLVIPQKMIFKHAVLPGMLTYEKKFFDIYREFYHLETPQNSLMCVISSFLTCIAKYNKRVFYIHHLDDTDSVKKDLIIALNIEPQHTCYILYTDTKTQTYYLLQWKHHKNKEFYDIPHTLRDNSHACSLTTFQEKKESILQHFTQQQAAIHNQQSSRKRQCDGERIKPLHQP